MGKVEPCEHNAAKFQLLWNQLASLQSLGRLPLQIFNPMRVLPKPSSIPQKYFQRELASLGKLEPCEYTKAKNEIVYHQPLGKLPNQSSTPWEYSQSQFQPHLSTFKDS